MFTWNNNYKDLEQVAEWLPEFTEIRAEVIARAGFPYDAEFRGRIPGIAGEREDTAIYLLQGLYRQRELDARVAGWLAEGFRPLETLAEVQKFARVILYRSDRSGEWHEYADARLIPETNERQAEVSPGRIHALIPKGKRTHGTLVGANSFAVLVQ